MDLQSHLDGNSINLFNILNHIIFVAFENNNDIVNVNRIGKYSISSVIHAKLGRCCFSQFARLSLLLSFALTYSRVAERQKSNSPRVCLCVCVSVSISFNR